jgi:hypothetical protein
MFKFTNNTFHVTRGDSGSVTISYQDGSVLPAGATLMFRVYEQNGFDSDPIIDLAQDLEEGLTSYELVIDGEETSKFDNPAGEKEAYWYELKIGPDNTVLGYDETGAKIFYVYPTGKDK